MKNDINEIKQKILPILQDYGVKKIALFGSCVRDERDKCAKIIWSQS